MSAYMNEFVSFNVLDSDYLEKKEQEQLLPDNNPDEIKMKEIQVEIEEKEAIQP